MKQIYIDYDKAFAQNSQGSVKASRKTNIAFNSKIVIAPIEYSEFGYVEGEASEYDLDALERRTSRTGTLGGSVEHEDYGFTHKDRNISFTFNNPSPFFNIALEAIAENGGKVYVTCFYDFFICLPLRVKPHGEKTTIFLAVDDVL